MYISLPELRNALIFSVTDDKYARDYRAARNASAFEHTMIKLRNHKKRKIQNSTSGRKQKLNPVAHENNSK